MEASGVGAEGDTNENVPQNATANHVDPPELKEKLIPVEIVDFKVIFNKNKYDISFPVDNTVQQLKVHLQDIIGVPESMQKVMFKGLAKPERSLRDLGIAKGAKVMVVGSRLDDVLAVSSTPSKQALQEEKDAATAKEPFCTQPMHRKVLDKGVPDDALVGLRGRQMPLPTTPLSGMLNKAGGKVRLTFKMELDQVWIGTKERTEKIPMSSIKGVVSEPIEGFEQYHILAIQMGTTDASRYWVYWVPAQYVDAIKDAILGKWQLF